MPYVDSIERMGIEKGRKKGLREGRQEGRQEGRKEGRLAAARESVLEALAVRFGVVPDVVAEAVGKIDDPSALKRLLQAAIRAESLEAFGGEL